MVWARLDDTFPLHPKIVRAGGDAAWLHVCAICYCCEHLTDGRFAKSLVPRLSDRRAAMALAEVLVEVGCWREDGDEYVINDFLTYNRSKADVEAERQSARERRTSMASRSGDVRTSVRPRSPDVRTSENGPDPTRESSDEDSFGAPAPPKAKKASRGTRIPEEFIVTAEMQDWVRRECPDIDWKIHTKRFVAYWKGESGSRAVKKNWGQAWRTWQLKEQSDAERRGPTRTHL